MWTVVDGGLGTFSEVCNDWTLDDYMQAVDYLNAKASKEKQAVDESQARARGGRG